MVKRDLLKTIDDGLLDKLYGFCYARTNDSYEAEELCSDIVYALIRSYAKWREMFMPIIPKNAANIRLCSMREIRKRQCRTLKQRKKTMLRTH